MLGHIFPRCYNNMIQRQLIMKRKVLKLFMKFAEDCLKKSTVVHPIKVKEMIIMTKHHFTDAHASTEVFGTEDVHYLLDCDMAILGKERKVYEKYSAAIRQEYAHIDNIIYCQKRVKVLQGIIRSPKIFATETFY